MQSDLVEKMSIDPRERGKANMRAQVARMPQFGDATARSGGGDEQPGSSRGTSLMAAQLRRQGIEPRRG